MQAIHDTVTVFVTQRELQARAPKPGGASASTTALQYVAGNSGFDVVKFRVDFRESASIRLHRPAARGGGSTANDTLQKATQEMVFDCELRPFERRVLAYVAKRGAKRAFVRVQYTVTAVVTPTVDVIVEAQERAAKVISQQLQRSNHTFNHVSKWKALPCRPGAEVGRACAEINRYFQDVGVVFVDASFPPQATSLYGSEAPNRLSEADSAIYTLCTWEHLHNMADSSWTFVDPTKERSKLAPHEPASSVAFTSGLPAQDSFLCALSVVAPYCGLWLHRWFPTLDTVSRFEKVASITVALCNRGIAWQHLLVDLFFPSFPLGRGLMTPRNAHGELYAALLHKAYAKLKGSYAAVSGIPTMNILRELTGSPWVCLYRSTTDADPSIKQVQLQEAVRATLPHRRPESDDTSSLVVVSCGKVDDHHRAFRIVFPSGEDSRVTSVVLHDASGKYLRQQIAGKFAEFDRDQDPSALRLSWEQLSALEPAVWSLSPLGQRHEQRLRQIFLHEGDTVKMTAVISVPSLTTIVLAASYSAHFHPEACDQQPQVDLEVRFAFVEADLSLTSMGDSTIDDLAATSTRFQDLADNHDGVYSKQVVRTLHAGEYVVTVSATRPGRSESLSKAEEGKPASDMTILTPALVDANLQLAFDCLDREGRQELSESDVGSFLQLYEHVLPSQHGKEALFSFLHQHGSSSRSEKGGLTLDDFREIYLGQAIRDCKEGNTTDSASSRTVSSASIRARLQELVWQDLLRLLPGSSWGVEADFTAESSRSELDCREVVQVVCCFHSDTPLLSVVSLLDERSSLEANI
ncbi:hypothetical protein PHYPSEUDO_001934 [Phytophthora pseudosyringae]|uniref:Calpain catalytic domain-containing protein n=1 Tax=Phytophthora pseudosyringae TaxID=221518 RepID=A0A8T1VUF4_9STRA|nr:hypothetical protein PHYPSEUDO_001934 [Phytophthora pseudosyringae]